MKQYITFNNIVFILKTLLVIILLIVIFSKSFNVPEHCSFSLQETTPIQYNSLGMLMEDGSVWGSYTESMLINHTYIF